MEVLAFVRRKFASTTMDLAAHFLHIMIKTLWARVAGYGKEPAERGALCSTADVVLLAR